MSQESIERLSEIWRAWGSGKYPSDAKVETFLSTLEAEARSVQDEASLGLRSVQCVLLDSEGVGAASRPALHEITKGLAADWSMGDTKDVAFVQAMLLAVRPEAPALAELMVAGRAMQRGRDKQRPRLTEWLASGRKNAVQREGASIAVPSFDRRPVPSFEKFDLAANYLSSHSRQGWHFSAIASYLLDMLDELNIAIHLVYGDQSNNVWNGTAEESINFLRQNITQNWNFQSFSDPLIAVVQHFSERLIAVGSAYSLEPSFGKLFELRSESHAFNVYGRDLIHVLVQLKTEILRIHHIRETQSWQEDYRRWAEDVTAQALSQKLASAEQKLLWWGQSRYCSPLRRPYRSLRADPLATVWWAAVEVAELGKPLEFAPLSAFLVNTLETLGLETNEKKSASAWLTSLAKVLKAVPSEQRRHITPKDPLKSLAEKDALGLPVTWLRLGVEGELSSTVALDLDVEIDLGDLAEWLLGELLLDHRMAP